MGPCILICQHCHVLNNKTLMNHFPFGREKEKNISLLLDIIPVLHIAHDRSTHKSQPTLPRLPLLVYAPPTTLLPPAPPRCLSYPSLSPIFLTLTIFLSVLCGSYFSSWRAGQGSKYPVPQTADPQWPCNLRVSDASPKVSHSKAPVLQHSGCSTDPVIHQPARSPARSYWFLFPQSPGEGERKD